MSLGPEARKQLYYFVDSAGYYVMGWAGALSWNNLDNFWWVFFSAIALWIIGDVYNYYTNKVWWTTYVRKSTHNPITKARTSLSKDRKR